MSKSNKEKERIKKIKIFEKKEIPFDKSILKLKLGFFIFENYLISKKNTKRKVVVTDDIKNQFKYIFTNIISNHLSHIKIYNYKVNIELLSLPVIVQGESKLQVSFQTTLYYKNKFLCDIASNNRIFHKIFEHNDAIDINSFLSEFLLKFNSIYQSPLFINDSLSKSRIKKSFFNNSKFKNFTAHKNVNSFITYIDEYNKFFKIQKYHIVYDISNNCFSTLYMSNKEQSFYKNNIQASTSNIGILKMLSQVGIINFNIDNLTEEEVFEMYELLSY